MHWFQLYAFSFNIFMKFSCMIQIPYIFSD